MSEATQSAMRTTASIAFKSWPLLTENEREAVLIALIEVGDDEEAQLAEQNLFGLREQRRLQGTLKAVLESNSRNPFGK